MSRHRFVAAALLALAAAPALAARIACHYDYGGESRLLLSAPVASPYAVPLVQVGSYFQFRVVFQDQPADLASVKIYVYADTDDGSTPLHQTSYPLPLPPASGPYGFTGLNWVYEPKRDGELRYWCEWQP